MVELLAVTIIIGKLAALAIPVFLNQRAQAHDAAARQDLGSLAKMVSAEFLDGATTVTVTQSSSSCVVNGDPVAPRSDGVELAGFMQGSSGSTWCVNLVHPDGSTSKSPGLQYQATDGFGEGACS